MRHVLPVHLPSGLGGRQSWGGGSGRGRVSTGRARVRREGGKLAQRCSRAYLPNPLAVRPYTTTTTSAPRRRHAARTRLRVSVVRSEKA